MIEQRALEYNQFLKDYIRGEFNHIDTKKKGYWNYSKPIKKSKDKSR